MYVQDVDATYKKALGRRSDILHRSPPISFTATATAGVKDQFGNFWWIATHIEDVPKEEMARRAQEYLAKKK